MITNKHIGKIVIGLLAMLVLLCLLAVCFSDTLSAFLKADHLSTQYQNMLFNTDEVLDIQIQIDPDDWQSLKENALNEEYQKCDVTVAGQTFYQVGIRPKGNTSLSSIANNPDTDRYSFKLEFDQFVDGQTCFGLDKLVLNNSFADTTYMKEALIYDMFAYLGADAPLYNYAKISVNGEYWGLYLALEAVEDSFLLRNYGSANGALYKPDSMDFGDGKPQGQMPGNQNWEMPDGAQGKFKPEGGNFSGERPAMPEGRNFSGERPAMPEGANPPADMSTMPEGAEPPADRPTMPEGGNFSGERPAMPEGMGKRQGGMGMGGGIFGNRDGGSNLNYTDDNLESYQSIWNGSVNDTTEAQHQKVVTALKNIAEGNQLEEYMDIENLVKYMAVHVFSVNQDSLSGNMAHNYYLYEYNGRLNLLPWDYNLALGGMNGGNATSIINDAIDTPFSGTKFFDALLANQNYKDLYHHYLKVLVEEYIEGGGFDRFYERTKNAISSLVETDPTAFYSYEEYLTGIDALYRTVKLRGESIAGQLAGTIPATDEEQKNDSSALIDASSINLNDLGKMQMGRGGENRNPFTK